MRDSVMPALQASKGMSTCPCWPFGRFVTGPPSCFDGSAQVEEWEIAAMHREQRSSDGACVRATWVKVDPDQLDRGIDFYKMTILPALEELEGFCSASLLVDERPVVAWPPRASTTQKRWGEQGTTGQDQSDRQRGSKRRGTRPMRLLVGGRTPACTRDGLTGSGSLVRGAAVGG
jgi:hypothetical protein